MYLWLILLKSLVFRDTNILFLSMSSVDFGLDGPLPYATMCSVILYIHETFNNCHKQVEIESWQGILEWPRFDKSKETKNGKKQRKSGLDALSSTK